MTTWRDFVIGRPRGMHEPSPSFPWDDLWPVNWFLCSCGTVFGFHPISEKVAKTAFEKHLQELSQPSE